MIYRDWFSFVSLLLFFEYLRIDGKRYSCDRQRSCGCGSADVDFQGRIINGEQAVPHSWSMLVSIRYNDALEHVCGGTILTDSYVLTAAHCFESIEDEIDSATITILAGIHQQSEASGIIRQADRVIFYPNRTSSWTGYHHDIALLHLSEPLTLHGEAKVRPICLPGDADTEQETNDLAVVGWGRISADGSESDTLQQAIIANVDPNTTACLEKIADPHSQACAQSLANESTPTLCYGDFGGPILRWNDDHWEQVGVASHSENGCDPHAPIVYMRLSYYLDWISRHIRQENETATSVTIYECDRSTVPCGCGAQSVEFIQPRLTGGQTIIPYSWSMVVSIRLRNSDRHACGGSILNESFILTAASCVAHAPIFGISVVTGFYNQSNNYTHIRQVDTVFIHPYYQGSSNNNINDIAILHLSQPLNFVDNAFNSPTCVSSMHPFAPNPIYYPSAEALLAVVGWTNDNGTDRFVLRQAEVFAANSSDSNCPISGDNQNLQFCAGTEKGDTVPCRGDLGSPIFQWYGNRWLQVGLVTSEVTCNQSGTALGLYTRLVSYYDWIHLITTNAFTLTTPATTTTTTTPENPQVPQFYQCNRTSTCGCGSTPVILTPSRVVGGEEALAYSWPMMISLRTNRDDNQHQCGGTILSDTYILTAAHCLSGYESGPVEGISIAAGMNHLLDSKQIRRTVDRIYIHPNYSRRTNGYHNDIALLHLNASLNTDASVFVTKTCIHRVNPPLISSQYIKNATRLTIVGWGTTEYGVSMASAQLRQVEVFAVDNDHPTCEDLLEDGELQFCAGLDEGGKDSCQGDSGGPIFQWAGQYWEQVGVVSYGDGCAKPRRPGVYTRLSYYYNWMNDILNNDHEFIHPTSPMVTNAAIANRRSPIVLSIIFIIFHLIRRQ